VERFFRSYSEKGKEMTWEGKAFLSLLKMKTKIIKRKEKMPSL
jgi:hypothetical protein